MSLFHPIKDPVEGTAHVVGVSAVDPEFMRQPCTMQLVIEAPGVEAFSIRQDFEIDTGQWPDPGQLLPVTFDRAHHERIAIDWDRVPTSGELAAQDATALAAAINAGTVGQAASAPTAVEDPLDRLEKLAELHAKGILTDDEFAAQKAKILESP
ncbi:MAG: hypothetical protein JWN32_2289 [Solirubrobacterales bacterium]|jgi:hypothetical protein|nr:hypothetical protein [Solirubrobacterales bacterium]